MAPGLPLQIRRSELIHGKSIYEPGKGDESRNGRHGGLVAAILEQHEESTKGNVPAGLGVDEGLRFGTA